MTHARRAFAAVPLPPADGVRLEPAQAAVLLPSCHAARSSPGAGILPLTSL
jgi:hypothetical protein